MALSLIKLYTEERKKSMVSISFRMRSKSSFLYSSTLVKRMPIGIGKRIEKDDGFKHT